jgi:hypothetical protein
MTGGTHGGGGAGQKRPRGRPKRAPEKPTAPPEEDEEQQFIDVQPLVDMRWDEEDQLMPQPAAPPTELWVFYLLTGGGTSVGKRAFSGCRARRRRPIVAARRWAPFRR